MFSLFSVLSCVVRRWLAALVGVLALATGGTVASAQTAQFSYAIVPLNRGGSGDYSTGLAVDSSGNLYAAYTSAQSVIKIPPGCAFSSCVTTLGGGFNNPYSVVLDASGNIYVADTGHSAVKEMPAGCPSAACVTMLGGGFNGPNGVAVDGSGNVYVADTYNHLLKEMPAGCPSAACVTTLGDGFDQPDGVAVDGNGNIFVSDYHDDGLPHQIDEVMTRGVNFFTLPVGQSTTETLTFTFKSSGTIGAPAVLTQGVPNLDFTDVGTGTCTTNGTSQNYNAGDICKVNVKFTTKYPGARHGAVNLVHSSRAVIATANLYSIGTGPQVIYPSLSFGNIGVYGSFTQAWGVALDGSRNIYVADRGDNTVKVMPAGCEDSTCVTPLGGGFNTPRGVAVDGGGNIYVADFGNGVVKVMPPGCTATAYGNGTCTVTTLAGGFTSPAGVAVDGIGNVYVTDNVITTVKKIPLGCTSAACVTTLGGGFTQPYGLAADDNGNIFVADTFNLVVKKIPPDAPPLPA
jgi:sugar lactone lactonase YvrE